MRPERHFLKQPKSFWATVRLVSQILGYTDRATKQVRVPSVSEMASALQSVGLNPAHVLNAPEIGNDLGVLLQEYFTYRADILNNNVRQLLMNLVEARAMFERLYAELSPTCPIPFNKQKGPMKAPALFTGIINMLVEAHSRGHECDYDPRQLTTFTANGVPLRTLARRVDGAFPSAVNPVAIWEIKEYYYTTTFGSRVADGVYETLLDGMELEELHEHEAVSVLHYLMVDAYKTWWEDGRSYLCRMIDILHMGYVDEVLFGREVLDRLPEVVAQWVASLKARN
jgi:hypothetical protein